MDGWVSKSWRLRDGIFVKPVAGLSDSELVRVWDAMAENGESNASTVCAGEELALTLDEIRTEIDHRVMRYR